MASSKFNVLIRQSSRYFWVALVGLAVDFGTLIFCTEVLGINYLISTTLGFTLGLIVNFFLSESYVFGTPTISRPILRFGIYAVIGLIGLCLLEILMWGQVELLSIPYALAKVLATIVVYTWNFFARRLIYQS